MNGIQCNHHHTNRVKKISKRKLLEILYFKLRHKEVENIKRIVKGLLSSYLYEVSNVFSQTLNKQEIKRVCPFN